MNAYLAKPIDPDAMFATLRSYYSRAEADAPAQGPQALPIEESDIPTIPGIDTEGGLGRVLGNKKLYMDLLKRYTEGQRDVAKRIGEALESGDLRLAERLAHTLKGVSGNIGAVEPQEVAGEIEAAIGAKSPRPQVNEALARLDSILSTTIVHIDSCLAQAKGLDSTIARVPGGGHTLSELVDGLTRLVEESDSEALDYLESSRDELCALCGSGNFGRLEASLRAYDFSAALGFLRELSSTSSQHTRGEHGNE